jgi:predicted ATPase
MAVANALGFAIHGDERPTRWSRRFARAGLVLVLDGCEHLSTRRQRWSIAIVAGAPGVLLCDDARALAHPRRDGAPPGPVPAPAACAAHRRRGAGLPAVELFVQLARPASTVQPVRCGMHPRPPASASGSMASRWRSS